MSHKTYYAPVSEALDILKSEGYSIDFNLEANCLVCQVGKFNYNEFEIKAVYRYEGNSDPADEAAVYAIESNTGLKGVLVTSYGTDMDAQSAEFLMKLRG